MSLPPEPRRTVSEEDLARLKRQRETSDSGYDDSLTALDAALWAPPDFPHPPPPPDETQVTPLNIRWEILRARPASPNGWRGRLARFVWSLVEPVLVEQQAFNSNLVDHINRNIEPQREAARSIETTISVLGQQIRQLCSFHSILMQYLQRITPFVNSKDYELAALALRRHEDTQSDFHSLNRSLHGLTAAVHGLSDEFLKHVESLTARVQRYDGRIDSAISAAGVVQQQAAALKRELDRLIKDGGTFEPRPAPAGDSRVRTSESSRDPAAASTLAGTSTLAGDSSLESWKYPGFEAAFRGSEEDITWRLRGYLPIFAGAGDVLDVGCGRGEFLDLLRKEGISARGIDLNFEMVELCRARGLEVSHADALSYLRGLPDASLGGLFAAQVVEHLPPDYLLAFLNEAERTLRPGAAIVLETVNVACWYAFFQSYIRDITHARPLHPETLQYLVTASGFSSAEIQFRVPVQEAGRLRRPPPPVWKADGDDKAALLALADAVDHNFQLLNGLLFSFLDYAIVARRA